MQQKGVRCPAVSVAESVVRSERVNETHKVRQIMISTARFTHSCSPQIRLSFVPAQSRTRLPCQRVELSDFLIGLSLSVFGHAIRVRHRPLRSPGFAFAAVLMYSGTQEPVKRM